MAIFCGDHSELSQLGPPRAIKNCYNPALILGTVFFVCVGSKLIFIHNNFKPTRLVQET